MAKVNQVAAINYDQVKAAADNKQKLGKFNCYHDGNGGYSFEYLNMPGKRFMIYPGFRFTANLDGGCMLCNW